MNKFQLMNDLSSLIFNITKSEYYDYVKGYLLECLSNNTIDEIHQRVLELIERLYQQEKEYRNIRYCEYFIVSKKIIIDLVNDIFLTTAHNNSETIESIQQVKRHFDEKQQKQQELHQRQQEKDRRYRSYRRAVLNQDQNSILGSIGFGDYT